MNDRAAIKKTIRDMTRGAYGILAVAALVAAGLLYGAVRLAS